MALSSSGSLSTVPPASDPVFRWPADLPQVHVGILLDVDEAIRSKRVANRGGERQEELLLAAQSEMRLAAMEAYRRIGIFHEVQVPTWMAAVNEILDVLQRKGIQHNVAKFTAEELRTVKPF